MRGIVLVYFVFFVCVESIAQSAEEVNIKAKEFFKKKDFKNAFPLIQKAAELGSAEAQFNYGNCFERGIEVERNPSKSFIWYMKSAKQGWAEAQLKVGRDYEHGWGVEKDDKQAFYWTQECAKQNEHKCIYYLLTYYEQGLGVNINIDSCWALTYRLCYLPTSKNRKSREMVTSIRLKMANGYRLGYEDGWFRLNKDVTKSYMWFVIYNENKKDLRVFEQEKNILIIKQLEKEITKNDIENGIKEAEIFLKHKLGNLSNLYETEFTNPDPTIKYILLQANKIAKLSERFGDDTKEWIEKLKYPDGENSKPKDLWVDDKTGDIIIGPKKQSLTSTDVIEFTDYKIEYLNYSPPYFVP